MPVEVVQVVCWSTARSQSWTGPGREKVLLLGAGPAGDDEDVGCGDVVEGGVGDEGEALGVAANRAALLADHDRLRAGQPAEDLVRADGVESRHVVVGEDGDLHVATIGLSGSGAASGTTPQIRLRPLRPVARWRRRRRGC